MPPRPNVRNAMTLEARAAPEFAAFRVDGRPLARHPAAWGRAPRAGTAWSRGLGPSTAPLRWFLGQLGYRSFGWGLGENRGFGRHVTDGLDELMAAKRDRGPVSVIGWSLGGLHAVDLTRRRPDAVRSLITLGSPLAGHRPPPATIPTTSIYSRSDAIVPWRSSVLAAAGRHENVEVRGSHLGLGHNPAVIVAVADRLAQRAVDWRPFSVPSWAGRWLRTAA